MMPWRDLCGTDGCHSGRFDGALGVERGVETEAKGAGGPPVADGSGKYQVEQCLKIVG